MEKETLKRLGEGLRKALGVSEDLPAAMQVALLKIAAQELKPEFAAPSDRQPDRWANFLLDTPASTAAPSSLR